MVDGQISQVARWAWTASWTGGRIFRRGRTLEERGQFGAGVASSEKKHPGGGGLLERLAQAGERGFRRLGADAQAFGDFDRAQAAAEAHVQQRLLPRAELCGRLPHRLAQAGVLGNGLGAGQA